MRSLRSHLQVASSWAQTSSTSPPSSTLSGHQVSPTTAILPLLLLPPPSSYLLSYLLLHFFFLFFPRLLFRLHLLPPPSFSSLRSLLLPLPSSSPPLVLSSFSLRVALLLPSISLTLIGRSREAGAAPQASGGSRLGVRTGLSDGPSARSQRRGQGCAPANGRRKREVEKEGEACEEIYMYS